MRVSALGTPHIQALSPSSPCPLDTQFATPGLQQRRPLGTLPNQVGERPARTWTVKHGVMPGDSSPAPIRASPELESKSKLSSARRDQTPPVRPLLLLPFDKACKVIMQPGNNSLEKPREPGSEDREQGDTDNHSQKARPAVGFTDDPADRRVTGEALVV